MTTIKEEEEDMHQARILKTQLKHRSSEVNALTQEYKEDLRHANEKLAVATKIFK